MAKTIKKKEDETPKTPLTQKQLRGIIEELMIQEDSRERVKDMLKDIKAATGISSTVIRKLAVTIMKDKKEDVLEENDKFAELLESISPE